MDGNRAGCAAPRWSSRLRSPSVVEQVAQHLRWSSRLRGTFGGRAGCAATVSRPPPTHRTLAAPSWSRYAEIVPIPLWTRGSEPRSSVGGRCLARPMSTAATGRSGVDDLGPDALLAPSRTPRYAAAQAELDQLQLAYQWCLLHPATPDTGTATWGGDGDLDADESLGGDGTPAVAAFAPEPLGLALGVPTSTAMTLMADALDLVHRLPHTWRRAQTLDIPLWRARRVAQKTHALTMKAAAHVDRVLAPRLHTVGVTLLDRTVAQAIAKHMPEEHATREERSQATWDVTLHHPNPTEYAGTSELHITGDTMTLTHLHDRICATAADLKTAGDQDPLGVRKTTRPPEPGRHPEDQALPAPRRRRTRRPGREARPRHRRPDPRLGRPLPGHHPTRPPHRPHRRGRRPRPTRLDARPGHPPRPPLRVPALPTRRPGCDLDHIIPFDDTGPPGQTRPAQPRPAVPKTPPRQDHRPLAIPPTTRRHLPMDRPGRAWRALTSHPHQKAASSRSIRPRSMCSAMARSAVSFGRKCSAKNCAAITLPS